MCDIKYCEPFSVEWNSFYICKNSNRCMCIVFLNNMIIGNSLDFISTFYVIWLIKNCIIRSEFFVSMSVMGDNPFCRMSCKNACSKKKKRKVLGQFAKKNIKYWWCSLSRQLYCLLEKKQKKTMLLIV